MTRSYNSEQDNSEQNKNNRNSNNNNESSGIRNKNILINTYNPISDSNLRNSILLKNNRNIIGNTYDNSDSSGSGGVSNNNIGGVANGGGINNSTSRPSHKTHVEIITKNGATKKPNIIVNSYEPDVTITGNINHNNQGDNNFNFNVRNDLSELNNAVASANMDRKSTCMLYLQADHTFFEKMGSDEASIEAITRHVQRANVIYRTTGKCTYNAINLSL